MSGKYVLENVSDSHRMSWKSFQVFRAQKWQPCEWNNTKSYELHIGCFDFCCTCSLKVKKCQVLTVWSSTIRRYNFHRDNSLSVNLFSISVPCSSPVVLDAPHIPALCWSERLFERFIPLCGRRISATCFTVIHCVECWINYSLPAVMR